MKQLKAENAKLKRASARQSSGSVPKPSRGRAATGGGGGNKKDEGGNKKEDVAEADEGGDGSKPKKAVRATSSRLYNPRQLLQKREELQQKKTEEELKNCSFMPSTATKAGEGGVKRDGKAATNRLFDLAKRQQEKRANLASKKEELEVSDCTFSPSIDKKSAAIASASPEASQNTFQRLAQPVARKPREMVCSGVVLRVRATAACFCAACCVGALSCWRSGLFRCVSCWCVRSLSCWL